MVVISLPSKQRVRQRAAIIYVNKSLRSFELYCFHILIVYEHVLHRYQSYKLVHEAWIINTPVRHVMLRVTVHP